MDRNEDIREMIRTEIQSISVLEERIAFKEMMEGVFLNLYEKNEEMYRALEMIWHTISTGTGSARGW